MTFSSRPYNPPAKIKLEYFHVDDSLIIVNKQNGLLTVPGKGPEKQDCLISRVQEDYSDALIVHRLDMETSGLVLMARSKKFHRDLSILFQNREIAKSYIALLAGKLSLEQGEVDLPLIVDWPNKPMQKVDYETGKPSLTCYSLIAYNQRLDQSRVELRPVTGRTHQLRLHMSSLGNPILGDRLYGASSTSSSNRLMLHARTLEFKHPVTAEQIRVKTEPEF